MSIIQIEWQGERLELHAEKGIFWPKKQCLFIADTHFGKAATFRSVGIPVSEKTTSEDCNRLTHLIHRTEAQKLVILGDMLHSRIGKVERVRDLLIQWRNLHKDLEIHLVRGNHDQSAGDPWSELNVLCHNEPWKLFDFNCAHTPATRSLQPGLAGHLHPAIRLSERFGPSIRLSCFWIQPKQIVLPAFGSFTGNSIIEPKQEDRIYATDGEELLEIPNRKRK